MEIGTVLVTGASSGIGLEVCRRFAAAGAAVGMIARDPDKLDAAAQAVAASTSSTVARAAADVADAGAVAAAIETLTGEVGALDALVNNAGIGAWGAVVDTDAETFRRMIEVNYLGAVHATAAVLPGMLDRRRGRIVNVASIAGRIGAPFEAAYTASKFALIGYSEALAIELTGTGVGVSLIDPGPVDTGFFARRGHDYAYTRPRPIAAEAVADAVVTAAHRGRAERFLPRWLRFAHVAKTIAPAAYRIGIRRMFATHLGQRRARGDA